MTNSQCQWVTEVGVDGACYRLSLNVEKALFLKLKAVLAERNGYGLKFAGGRHRHWVMQIK